MLMPSILSNDFMDDFFGVPRITGFGHRMDTDFARMMTTDVKENENDYTVDMNLPGFAKEDIKAELKDGILTVSAGNDEVKEEKDETGKVIYSERHTGKYSRSYGVGKHITEADIKASYDNGVLTLEFPTEASKPEEPKRMIAIQ